MKGRAMIQMMKAGMKKMGLGVERWVRRRGDGETKTRKTRMVCVCVCVCVCDRVKGQRTVDVPHTGHILTLLTVLS